MLNKMERYRLGIYQKAYGASLTSEEALLLAINAEQIKLDCGAFDPAFSKFAVEQRHFEEMALLLEKDNDIQGGDKP